MTSSSIGDGPVGLQVPQARAGQPRVAVAREDPQAGVVVCTVTGDVDAGSVAVVQQALADVAADRAVCAVVADLSAVGFLGAAGLETLLVAAGRAAVARRGFVVVPGTSATRRAFEVSGAEAAIALYGCRAEAVSAAATWTGSRSVVDGDGTRGH